MDGSLYQCHKCFYTETNKIGHISDNDIFTKILNYKISLENKINTFTEKNCKSCKTKYCIYCSLLLNNMDSICDLYRKF